MRLRSLFYISTLIIFSSCEEEPNLDGTWQDSGCFYDEEGNCEFSWYHEYTFEGETYQMTGYPPIEESGTLEYTETKDNEFKVKLIPDDPNLPADKPTIIKYNDDSISINGATYLRIKESEVE